MYESRVDNGFKFTNNNKKKDLIEKCNYFIPANNAQAIALLGSYM